MVRGPCRRGITALSQKALVGTIPASMAIMSLLVLAVKLPLTFHRSLHDEKFRREDTPSRQGVPVVSRVNVAASSSGAVPCGSDRICHL
jgi:hypothetical protein